jgi:hypothetical protein
MTEQPVSAFDRLVDGYLGLESMEATFELLDLCGASIDRRALPLLKRRLREEEERVPSLEARGYIRMREKSEQLIASLKPLIVALEETCHDTPHEPPGTQHRRPAP